MSQQIIHITHEILRRPLLRLALVMILHVVVAHMASAQEEPFSGKYLGIYGGVEQGITPVRFPIRAISPGCGEFMPGESSGFWFGAGITFPRAFSSRLGMSLRLGLLRTEERFVGDVADPIWTFDPSLMRDVALPREFRYDRSTSAGVLDVLVNYRIVEGWNISAGGRTGYITRSRTSQTDNLLEPGYLVFEDGGTSKEMDEGEKFTMQPLLLGTTVASSYIFPIGPRVALAAEISGTAMLVSPVPELEWRNFSLRGGIGLIVDLTSVKNREEIAAVPPPDTTHIPKLEISEREPVEQTRKDTLVREAGSETALSSAALGASIRMYGIDERGEQRAAATAHMIETVRRREIMPDWSIWFDSPLMFPPEWDLFTSRSEADLFTVDSLADIDEKGIQENLLNIIGERLRKFPGASIALKIPASREISRRRGEAIQRYLVDIWGINPSRIGMTIEEPGIYNDRNPLARRELEEQIWITSEFPEVDTSVIFTRTERNFIAPVLKLEPLYQSDTGIKEWNIVLDHQGTTIAKYSSSNAGEGDEINYDWHPVYDQLTNDSSILTATFTVKDLKGEALTVRSQIPLVLQQRRRAIHHDIDLLVNSEEISYMFPPADSSPPDLNRQQTEAGAEAPGNTPGPSFMDVVDSAGTVIPYLHQQAARLAREIDPAILQRDGDGIIYRRVHSISDAGEISGTAVEQGSIVVTHYLDRPRQ